MMQRRAAIALCTLSLALAAVGCGVNEDLYNSTVKDRDAQKKKLADTQSELEQERAAHKKDVVSRDARVTVLSDKLTALGQDVSRLETETGTTPAVSPSASAPQATSTAAVPDSVTPTPPGVMPTAVSRRPTA